MAFVTSGFGDDGLPQLGALDQLNQLWKQPQETTAADNSRAATTGSKSVGSQDLNMAEQNGAATNPGTPPQAVDLEATPDLELKITAVFGNGNKKNMEGSLNPTRSIQQLKARLAAKLGMQAHLVEIYWSKILNNGQQAQPVLLDDTQNLMFYEVETDDTIIIRENADNL